MMTAARAIRLLPGALLLLWLTGCQLEENTHYRREPLSYAGRDAARDAQANFRRHDYEIYMTQGNGVGFPGGLSHKKSARLARRYGIRVMNLGSDAIVNEAEGKRYEAKAKYAADYNREMAHLLDARLPKH